MGPKVPHMVQLINVNAPSINYRSHQHDAGDTIRFAFEGTLPVQQLVDLLSLAPGCRLVCKGSELDFSKSLEQQNCKTNDTIYCLECPPKHSCTEWTRTGRCPAGGKCFQGLSHTMKLSPRYVEHRAASMSAESSAGSSAAQSSADSTPEASPPHSPLIEPLEALCRNWAKHGECKFGDSCFYAHTRESSEENWDAPKQQWGLHSAQWGAEQWAGDRQQAGWAGNQGQQWQAQQHTGWAGYQQQSQQWHARNFQQNVPKTGFAGAWSQNVWALEHLKCGGAQ